MPKNRFQWTIILVTFAILGSAWIIMSQDRVTASQGPIAFTEAPVVGHIAPDFTAETAVGQTVNLHDVRLEAASTGQPIVLNFWASWCAPCRVEMPHFQNASRKYNGRAAIIGVNQGESANVVTDFGNEFLITYPLLVDDENEVNHLYNINSLPTTIFIGADGVVQEVLVGTISQAVLEDRIESLLTE